ncbi:MAG: DUF3857 domain-containing protein [Deltaproteobacteria bacterium]|nr:DUF3857 domain-containing protein [Deltaproteobacteria bacterium]
MTKPIPGGTVPTNSVWLAALVFFSGFGNLGCSLNTSIAIPPDVAAATVPEHLKQGHDAVYLYDIGWVYYGPAGLDIPSNLVFTRLAKIKLLTRAATEAGKFGIISISHRGKFIELEAVIHKPDGSHRPLTKSDIVTTALHKSRKRNQLENLYVTRIIFPDLNQSDIIEYKYTHGLSEAGWIFGHVDVPVLFSRYIVERSFEIFSFEKLLRDHQNLKPKKTTQTLTGSVGFNKHVSWTATNIPAIIQEPLMPPLIDLASSIVLWAKFSEYTLEQMSSAYFEWVTVHQECPRSIRQLVMKITTGVGGSSAKIRTIIDWVKTNIVVVNNGVISGVIPSMDPGDTNVENVLENRMATAEQAASLAWLMLHAAGIDTAIVLTSNADKSEFDDDVTDLTLCTHVFLALDDDGVKLFDLTDRFRPYDSFPTQFQGRRALWIEEDYFSLKNLPASQPTDNQTKISVDGQVEPTGDVVVTTKLVFSGEPANLLRKALSLANKQQQEAVMTRIIGKSVKNIEIRDLVFDDVEDPYQPLCMRVEFAVPKHAKIINGKMIMSLAPFINLIYTPPLIAKSRTNQVLFPFVADHQLKASIRFPAGYRLATLPKGLSHKKDKPPFTIGLETIYKSSDNTSLEISRRFVINNRRVAVESYPALRDQVREFLEQNNTLVVLEPTAEAPEDKSAQLP